MAALGSGLAQHGRGVARRVHIRSQRKYDHVCLGYPLTCPVWASQESTSSSVGRMTWLLTVATTRAFVADEGKWCLPGRISPRGCACVAGRAIRIAVTRRAGEIATVFAAYVLGPGRLRQRP